MNIDDLSPISRDFFETSKLKMTASLVLASIGIMLLGFSSATGGEATYSNSVAHDKTLFGSNYTSADSIALQYEMMGMNNTYLDITATSYYAIKAGDGFSCFSFLVGSIAVLIMAMLVSPVCCGSANEKRMLRSPQEMEHTALRGSNQHRNSGGSYDYNNAGSASSDDHNSSKPITGSNPSSNIRPVAAKTKKSSRKSDPLSSRGDWPEAGDEDENDGNDLSTINVSIDR